MSLLVSDSLPTDCLALHGLPSPNGGLSTKFSWEVLQVQQQLLELQLASVEEDLPCLDLVEVVEAHQAYHRGVEVEVAPWLLEAVEVGVDHPDLSHQGEEVVAVEEAKRTMMMMARTGRKEMEMGTKEEMTSEGDSNQASVDNSANEIGSYMSI